MHFPPCSICRRRLVTFAEQAADVCIRCAKDPAKGRETAKYDAEMNALEKETR